MLAGMNQEQTNEYNRNHCKSIAEDLESYYNGNCRCCPECGEIIDRDWDDVGDKFCCPSCHSVTDIEDWDQQSLWDYFSDCLDIEYRVGSDNELRSVCIMVACGGPNIYIDTQSKRVELYWWGDRAWYPIDSGVCDEIDALFEELRQC